MAKTVRTTVKKKKKLWYSILAPKMFNEMVIGETTTLDPETVLGRKMKVNLMNLTRNIKNQNISIKLDIHDYKDNKFFTKFAAYEIIPASIKRLVRRKRDRIDDSFICKTKDGVLLRIKPIILTRNKTNKSVLTAIRQAAKQALARKTASRSMDDFIKEVVYHKVQGEFSRQMKKIYPLRTFEFRVIKVVKKGTPLAVVPIKEEDRTEKKAPAKKPIKAKPVERPVAKEEAKAESKEEAKEEPNEEVKAEAKIEESKAEPEAKKEEE